MIATAALTKSKVALRLMGAVLATVISTYAVAIAYEKSLSSIAMALIALGPMMMSTGWLANFFQPQSKVGWTLILYGFNFMCGFMLSLFGPNKISVNSWDSNGSFLSICLLAIALNSWQILFHIDKAFRIRRVWHLNPKAQRLIAQTVCRNAFSQCSQEGSVMKRGSSRDCNTPP